MIADDGAPVRVLVVDDQAMIRAGLAGILAGFEDLEVVGEAEDGLAALFRLDQGGVDVVLLDLRMPVLDGVETIRRIRRDRSGDELPVLVLTTFDQDDSVLAAIQAGANGFLGKGAGPAELAAGIREVARGGRALSAAAIQALVAHVAAGRGLAVDPAARALFDELTPRELEVVQAVVSGASSADVAGLLFLSPHTVKTHLNRAMSKVGARDRGQLVTLAVRSGILP